MAGHPLGVEGPADLSWTILRSGHTPRGWPWYQVRKRGGQEVRVTVHAAQATHEQATIAITTIVARLPSRPTPTTI